MCSGISSWFIYFFLIYLFIFGCVGSSWLRVGFLFLVAVSGGLLFIAVRELLIAVASLVTEHRL